MALLLLPVGILSIVILLFITAIDVGSWPNVQRFIDGLTGKDHIILNAKQG